MYVSQNKNQTKIGYGGYGNFGQITTTGGAGPGPWSSHPQKKAFWAHIKANNGPPAIVTTDPAVMRLWTAWLALNPMPAPPAPAPGTAPLVEPTIIATPNTTLYLAIGGGVIAILLGIILLKK